MYCSNCSAENSETRKFCSECGFQIVSYCIKCGFPNTPSDKFCGGCGINLSAKDTASTPDTEHPHSSDKSSSSYDIKDLIDDPSQSKAKPEKKKKKTETENVSQDLIDNIFGPDESNEKES